MLPRFKEGLKALVDNGRQPQPCRGFGIGPDTAATLLIVPVPGPSPLVCFASLCGVNAILPPLADHLIG